MLQKYYYSRGTLYKVKNEPWITCGISCSKMKTVEKQNTADFFTSLEYLPPQFETAKCDSQVPTLLSVTNLY